MHNTIPPCLSPPVDGTPWAPPLDVTDVVIRLEAAGVTDAVARRDYGCTSIWNLAAICLPAQASLSAPRKPTRHPGAVVEYLKGICFALPLLLCSLAMLCFDYSLWGGEVGASMAAAAGLGTVASFIVAGGFVQAMAQRGLFFFGVEDNATAEAVCRRWARYGLLCLALTGLLLVAFSRLYDWLPAPFDWVAFGFHVTLGLLWVAAGILHMLERNLWTAIATAAGILIVVLLHQLGGIPLVLAQFVGLIAATAIMFGVCHWLLHGRRGKLAPRSTTPAEDIYHSWPYFIYGAFYYALVFADRLLSWTVPDTGSASSLQFRGDYETALNIAVIAFVVQVGLVRPCTSRFFQMLADVQASLTIKRRAEFNLRMKQAYRAASLRIVVFLLATSVCLCSAAFEWPGLLAVTLVCAVSGNALLVLALWNTSLLFRLSQPMAVISAIVMAVAADVFIGYFVTRLGSYQHAVLGLLAGTALFAVATTLSVSTRLESLDYYHFSANV